MKKRNFDIATPVHKKTVQLLAEDIFTEIHNRVFEIERRFGPSFKPVRVHGQESFRFRDHAE